MAPALTRSGADAAPLAPIEIATGIVFGAPRRPSALPSSSDPARMIAAAIRPALQRGRCFVSFSGGRDSSLVLAVAADIARREGMADPVPVTIRAPEEPRAEESEWQERVIAHLRIKDWFRLEMRDELDAVGPYAQRTLSRHGLLWPFNVHFHLPILEQAAGGTLLTGIGGDELWGAAYAPRMRFRRRLLQLGPHRLRAPILARREPIDYPWLRPAATREAQRVAGLDSAAEPSTAAARLAWSRGMRSTDVGLGALDRVANDCHAGIEHPLLSRPLWGALARVAPRGGFPKRDAALWATAGHVLPAEVITRSSKASFNRLFFHDHSRAFAREWSGDGVPERLVDARALKKHWSGDAIDAHSLTLLQAAWLASAPDWPFA